MLITYFSSFHGIVVLEVVESLSFCGCLLQQQLLSLHLWWTWQRILQAVGNANLECQNPIFKKGIL